MSKRKTAAREAPAIDVLLIQHAIDRARAQATSEYAAADDIIGAMTAITTILAQLAEQTSAEVARQAAGLARPLAERRTGPRQPDAKPARQLRLEAATRLAKEALQAAVDHLALANCVDDSDVVGALRFGRSARLTREVAEAALARLTSGKARRACQLRLVAGRTDDEVAHVLSIPDRSLISYFVSTAVSAAVVQLNEPRVGAVRRRVWNLCLKYGIEPPDSTAVHQLVRQRHQQEREEQNLNLCDIGA